MTEGAIFTALVTPFDESGALNLSALPELIDFQRSAGVDGLVISGTNGEGPSISVAERKQLLESVMRRRGSLRIIAGTGAANLPDAIELTKHAGEYGAESALVLPPFYFKNVSARGVVAYYEKLLESVGIPVLLYSIPQQSAVQITDDILRLLSENPRLAGIKDSQGDAERTFELIQSLPGRAVYAGADELLSRTLFSGAAGNISGTANGFPELLVRVRNAGESDRPQAQQRLNRAKTIILDYPLIAGNKSVLFHRGLPRMWVRPPLIDLSLTQENELIGRLREEELL